jgi:hypothetical protein
LGQPLGGAGIEPDLPVAFGPEEGGLGGEAQFNRAYEYLNERLPPFR